MRDFLSTTQQRIAQERVDAAMHDVRRFFDAIAALEQAQFTQHAIDHAAVMIRLRHYPADDLGSWATEVDHLLHVAYRHGTLSFRSITTWRATLRADLR